MTIREDVRVTVADPVDGTVHRRSRGRRQLSSRVDVGAVHPKVLAAAHLARRPGERLVIVSTTEVLLVPR